MIQVFYLEGLIESASSYPEISSSTFLQMIMKYQDEKEESKLPRAMIELSFIRATRGDEGYGLRGTLCRGELLETLLRLNHNF